MTSPRRMILISAALAATGGAATAGGPDREPRESPPPGFERQESVKEVDPDQAAHYAILRRPVESEDRMPDGFWINAGDRGEAPGLARRATVTARGASIYVVPARGYVCLKIANPENGAGGGTCNRTADALRGYIVGMSEPSGGPLKRWYGLVPDGIEEVRLTDATGAVDRLVPEGNVFVLETIRDIRLIEWGEVAVPIPEM